jgi:peptidyl-prolyl cis-trans isomerase SurA
MGLLRLIDRPGSGLDSLRKRLVSWQNMVRGLGPILLAAAAALGCSSASPRNEMAPTPKLDPPAEAPKQAVIAPPPERADGIAARVNNEIITWKDVLETLKDIKPGDVSPDLKKSYLRQMAEECMFLQAAKANNLSISEQEFEDAQRRDIKMYGSEEEWEKAIRLQYGTKTAYREKRRKELLIYKLYRHLMQQSWTNPGKGTPGLMLDFVAPEEIREYFDKHKDQFQAIEQISFMRIGLQFSNPAQKEVKQMLAESLLRKIKEGAEFAMLAFFYSDVYRAKQFRDLGVSRKDAREFYAEETVKYLFDVMKEAEISPIIEDKGSLNIFKMERKFSQKEESFEEAQVKIRLSLENKYREENRRRLRDHLRKDAYIWPSDLFDHE